MAQGPALEPNVRYATNFSGSPIRFVESTIPELCHSSRFSKSWVEPI